MLIYLLENKLMQFLLLLLEKEYFLRNITIGMLSGAIANGLANPTDVLKVRMQSNKNKYAKVSLWQCFKEIYSTEGFGGLYRVI